MNGNLLKEIKNRLKITLMRSIRLKKTANSLTISGQESLPEIRLNLQFPLNGEGVLQGISISKRTNTPIFINLKTFKLHYNGVETPLGINKHKNNLVKNGKNPMNGNKIMV
jgi:hypothetical protein